MIAVNPNARITKITDSYADDTDLIINLYFNSGNVLNSPKSILDVFFMLYGQCVTEHITTINIGHTDINTKDILSLLLNWGIVYQLSTNHGDRFVQAKNKLSRYTVHFPILSNINIMIAVLLQKLHVKSVFYNSATITKMDISQNIYYKSNDAGKDVATFIKNEMKIDTIYFAGSCFDVNNLNENVDIVVNSDVTNWFNIENYIVINTWNYKNVHFDRLNLLHCKTDISDNLKELIDGYILATSSIVDMQYSVMGIVD